MRTFECPGASKTPPKLHDKREKEMKLWRETENKQREILGPPTFSRFGPPHPLPTRWPKTVTTCSSQIGLKRHWREHPLLRTSPSKPSPLKTPLLNSPSPPRQPPPKNPLLHKPPHLKNHPQKPPSKNHPQNPPLNPPPPQNPSLEPPLSLKPPPENPQPLKPLNT